MWADDVKLAFRDLMLWRFGTRRVFQAFSTLATTCSQASAPIEGVERTGIEPVTSGLQSRRSPS